MAVLLIATLALPLHADTTFSIESTRGAPGTTVIVPVTLRGETNAVALQADLLFDPALLLPGDVTAGTVANNHVLTFTDLVPGVRRLLIYSLSSAPMTNGVVVNLGFTVPPGTSQHALRLSLSNVVLVTSAPSAISSTNRHGVIVLNPIFIGPGGHAGFFLSALAGQTNIVQASIDLAQWTDIGTVVPIDTVLEFTDTNAPSFAHRFYRTVPQP